MEESSSVNYLKSYPVEVEKESHMNLISSGNKGLSLNCSQKSQSGIDSTRNISYESSGSELNASVASVPLVELVGSSLFFEGQRVDFGRQNLMVKLFRAFLQQKQCRVSRLELIKHIYGHDDLTINNRRILSDFHNIVKLISRARRICEQNFSKDFERTWVWFDYDPFACEWVLIKPRHVRMNLT